MDVTPVSVEVQTRAPTGQTNAYVLGTDPAILVDPAARSRALDDALADRKVEHVVVTHTHPDHVGGVADYAAELDATVWARTGRESQFQAATGITPDATYRDGDVIAREHGSDSDDRTDDATDGSPVDAVRVLDTPGHAPDHVAFATGDAVLCGDLAIAEGSVVVGHPAGDMRAYLTSLRRLRARDPGVLYPGHGPRIPDPRAVCDRLIRHRLDRERRVLDAVGDDPRSIDDIVDSAYDKDVSHVRDLATATVRAHVEKLVHERRLAWTGDAVTRID